MTSTATSEPSEPEDCEDYRKEIEEAYTDLTIKKGLNFEKFLKNVVEVISNFSKNELKDCYSGMFSGTLRSIGSIAGYNSKNTRKNKYCNDVNLYDKIKKILIWTNKRNASSTVVSGAVNKHYLLNYNLSGKDKFIYNIMYNFDNYPEKNKLSRILNKKLLSLDPEKYYKDLFVQRTIEMEDKNEKYNTGSYTFQQLPRISDLLKKWENCQNKNIVQKSKLLNDEYTKFCKHKFTAGSFSLTPSYETYSKFISNMLIYITQVDKLFEFIEPMNKRLSANAASKATSKSAENKAAANKAAANKSVANSAAKAAENARKGIPSEGTSDPSQRLVTILSEPNLPDTTLESALTGVIKQLTIGLKPISQDGIQNQALIVKSLQETLQKIAEDYKAQSTQKLNQDLLILSQLADFSKQIKGQIDQTPPQELKSALTSFTPFTFAASSKPVGSQPSFVFPQKPAIDQAAIATIIKEQLEAQLPNILNPLLQKSLQPLTQKETLTFDNKDTKKWYKYILSRLELVQEIIKTPVIQELVDIFNGQGNGQDNIIEILKSVIELYTLELGKISITKKSDDLKREYGALSIAVPSATQDEKKKALFLYQKKLFTERIELLNKTITENTDKKKELQLLIFIISEIKSINDFLNIPANENLWGGNRKAKRNGISRKINLKVLKSKRFNSKHFKSKGVKLTRRRR